MIIQKDIDLIGEVFIKQQDIDLCSLEQVIRMAVAFACKGHKE